MGPTFTVTYCYTVLYDEPYVIKSIKLEASLKIKSARQILVYINTKFNRTLINSSGNET